MVKATLILTAATLATANAFSFQVPSSNVSFTADLETGPSLVSHNFSTNSLALYFRRRLANLPVVTF
jgi:hypothetical protein